MELSGHRRGGVKKISMLYHNRRNKDRNQSCCCCRRRRRRRCHPPPLRCCCSCYYSSATSPISCIDSKVVLPIQFASQASHGSIRLLTCLPACLIYMRIYYYYYIILLHIFIMPTLCGPSARASSLRPCSISFWLTSPTGYLSFGGSASFVVRMFSNKSNGSEPSKGSVPKSRQCAQMPNAHKSVA